MSNKYGERLKKMKGRRTDFSYIIEKSATEKFSISNYINEGYEKLNESDICKYILGAMQEVDEIYTKNTFEEAERIQNQLDKIKNKDLNFEYRYQGSVSNNTHIKAHSDIDILVITDRFVTLENPQVPSNPYKGNPEKDLLELRVACEEHLTKAFYAAEVDCSGAKSICLKGGSLRRKIDVVPSNWFNTNDYKETKNEVFRGIYVLDKYKMNRIKNTPFYHNYLIDKKDSKCCGNFRKLVRLMKNLKADSENNIDFSSYDITGLVYNMDDSKFLVGSNHLKLVKQLKFFIDEVYRNREFRENLYVTDKSRKIFDNNNKLKEFKKMKAEIDNLYYELKEEFGGSEILLESRSFTV